VNLTALLASTANFTTVDNLKIISRAEWGADESLRKEQPSTGGTHVKSKKELECNAKVAQYPDEFKTTAGATTLSDGMTALQWPLEYSPAIRKIVIHHTASEDDPEGTEPNYVAKVRSIYHFHAITRGWGDIGYNYLVDPDGNIYEGRYGGERVVAGHAYCYNVGTVGVATIGNLEKNVVPYSLLEGVLQVVYALAQKYNLDPQGTSVFHGQDLPNILGHRDVGSTSCPGKNLYLILDSVRKVITQGKSSTLFTTGVGTPDYDFTVLTGNQQILLKPNEKKIVPVIFKNTGQKTWDSSSTKLALVSADEGFTVSSAELVDPEVGPQEQGTFVLSLQAKNAGLFTLAFAPQLNNATIAKNFVLPVYVEGEIASSSVASSSRRKLTNAEWAAVLPATTTLAPGQDWDLALRLLNGSTEDWLKEKLKLELSGAGKKLSDQSKLHPEEETIATGDLATFNLKLQAPYSKRVQKLPLSFAVRFGARRLYTDVLKTIVEIPALILNAHFTEQALSLTARPGEILNLNLALQNDGNAVWHNTGKEKIALSLDPADRRVRKLIQHSSWESSLLISTTEEKSVAPGETAHFKFQITAPRQRRDYNFSFVPLLASGEKFEKVTLPVKLKVEGKALRRGETLEESGDRSQEIVSLLYSPQSNRERLFLIASNNFLASLKQTISSLVSGLTGTKSARVRRVQRKEVTATSTATGASVVISAEPTIRIRLSSFKENSATLTASGGFTLYKDGAIFQKYSANETATIGFFDLANGAIFCAVPVASGIFTITNFEHRPAWNPKLNDNLYRGTLEIRAVDGQLAIIDELSLEDYLRGVAEPMPGDPWEKVKTLAVLARTYAYYYIQPEHRKFPNYPYDGSDDASVFQLYLGANFEKRGPDMARAAEATRGEILQSGDRTIKTPFFNRSDGWTRTPEEASWPRADFYFTKKVADPWSCGGTSKDAGIICTGNRRGHGVGLSGAGAKGLAEEGKTMGEIINYFFDGLELKKKY
jgi:peptidoglycan hydrolase-like amidase